MARSNVINLLVNEFSLSREWLNQFKTNDLSNMLNEFKTKFKKD